MKNLISALITLTCTVLASAATIYVDANAEGNNDGSSWFDAYNHLQDALAYAKANTDINQVHVAQGTYTPDTNTTEPNGTGDRYASFALINNVALYGGFPTGGGNFSDRDPSIYETILSGDLLGNDTPNVDSSELANDPNRSDNSYHVFYHPRGVNIDSSAILDGFTVIAGNANDYPETSGGGMYNNGDDNNCSPTVSNCTFSNNSAIDFGGGISNYRSNPKITNCIFSNNWTRCGGGGMRNSRKGSKITNCTFSGNSTSLSGGGMHNHACKPKLSNCIFNGNSAKDGGGMYNHMSSPRIKNCTFRENFAYSGDGIFNFYYADPILVNCILWNSTTQGVTQISHKAKGKTTVTYSNIQGGWPGIGNIDIDPCFVEPDVNDFHLSSDSPCINYGDPNYIPKSNETDLDGLPRVIGGRIDMGCYEFNHQPVAVAGPNQVAYAFIDVLADVNLDGSASYDDDNDVLDYYWSWTIDDNLFEVNGVSPTITLPVGEHQIELIVDDGIDLSEPDYCTVTVIEPLRTCLWLWPSAISCTPRPRHVTAFVYLPRDIEPEDVNNQPLIMYSCGIRSEYQRIFRIGHGRRAQTVVMAVFDKDEICNCLSYGWHRVDVAGRLQTGQYFCGSNIIRITRPRHRHWPFHRF